MKQYFIIRNSEGSTTVETLDRKTLLERIEEGYWGYKVIFLNKVPDNTDTNYWGDDAILIIKGNVVTPEPEQVITKYNIE